MSATCTRVRTTSRHACWSWPITPITAELVRETVADTYQAWGVGPLTVGTVGDVAAQYAAQVRTETLAPYVCVHAELHGTCLAFSVAPADCTTDEPGVRLGPPPCGLESTEATHQLPSGTARYVIANLLSVRPT